MATPKHWGPMFWNMIHSVTYFLPPFLNKKQNVILKQFTLMTPNLLPCEICSEHMKEYLNKNELWNYAKKGKTPSIIVYTWWSEFHQNVSKKINHENKLDQTLTLDQKIDYCLKKEKKWKYKYYIEEPFQTISSWVLFDLFYLFYYHHKKNQTFFMEKIFYYWLQFLNMGDPLQHRKKYLWKPMIKICEKKQNQGKIFEHVEKTFLKYWKHYFQKNPELWNNVQCYFMLVDKRDQNIKKTKWISYKICMKKFKQINIYWNPYPEMNIFSKHRKNSYWWIKFISLEKKKIFFSDSFLK